MLKLHQYIKRNTNVPNTLTLARLIMVPIYWLVFLQNKNSKTLCLVIFCIASFTDFLDGYIARKYNLITDFGKLFDPLADKLMVISVLITHYLTKSVHILPIIIMAIKESLMILGAFFILSKYNMVVYSNIYGKASTVSFIISLILMFFHEFWQTVKIPFDTIMIWISVLLSLTALIIYAINAYKKIKSNRGIV